MPFPSMRRSQSITSAAPTSTFFGSPPRSAHVPPNGRESTIATCQPADLHFDATVEAAEPVPSATRSNFLFIDSFSQYVFALRESSLRAESLTLFKPATYRAPTCSALLAAWTARVMSPRQQLPLGFLTSQAQKPAWISTLISSGIFGLPSSSMSRRIAPR